MFRSFINNAMLTIPTLLADSNLVKGSTKLIADATLILTGLAAAITTLWVIILSIKKQNADDEGEARAIKKKIKSVIVCGIGITLAAGLVTVVFGYFK